MSNPLPRLRALYRVLHNAALETLHQLLDRLRAAWQRHLRFMNEQESYRAQVVAGVGAIVAVFQLDPRTAALLLAALGLHAAAHGHGPRPRHPWPAFREDEDWDYFK